MKNKIITSILILAILLCIGGLLLSLNNNNEKGQNTFVKTDYKNMDYGSIKKLMIVAHPDDEVLWGGSELIDDDYVVVCVTCGSDERRVKEFESVMKETNDKYIMLGYPDKTNGERDNWDSVRDDIIEDIEAIYRMYDWTKIVTHNPEGEYGHIHHKMTNQIVTDIVEEDELYYFGKYYSKKDLEEKEVDLVLIDEDTLARKEEILNLYVTQDKTIHETFAHMIPSENIISAGSWKAQYEK